MTFDPHTYVIEADLSRADVVALHELCAGKRLVEHGAGGSTLLFAQICTSVVSYEPSDQWVKLVTARLRKEGVTNVRLQKLVLPPQALQKADVYFIDGPVAQGQRAAWFGAALRQRAAPLVAVHDSRRLDIVEGLTALLAEALAIESVHYHYKGSNLLVVRLREHPVRWENWNLTEPKNRKPHLHR